MKSASIKEYLKIIILSLIFILYLYFYNKIDNYFDIKTKEEFLFNTYFIVWNILKDFILIGIITTFISYVLFKIMHISLLKFRKTFSFISIVISILIFVIFSYLLYFKFTQYINTYSNFYLAITIFLAVYMGLNISFLMIKNEKYNI